MDTRYSREALAGMARDKAKNSANLIPAKAGIQGLPDNRSPLSWG